jgi:hypothetical protein
MGWDNELRSKRKTWKKLKTKAPKIPNHTCPAIDRVLSKIDKIANSEKSITQYQHDQLMKRMEELRTANDNLRESGIYWYTACKKIYEETE